MVECGVLFVMIDGIMSVPAEKYTSGNMKRTLDSIKRCASLSKSKPAKERLGIQHVPVLSINPANVVIDELYLLLRIGDVFIRNLVWEVVDADRISQKKKTFTTFTSYLSDTCCSTMWSHIQIMGTSRH